MDLIKGRDLLEELKDYTGEKTAAKIVKICCGEHLELNATKKRQAEKIRKLESDLQEIKNVLSRKHDAEKEDAGIKVKENRYDMSIFVPNSQLVIHITTDERYKDFGKDAKEHMLFDEFKVKVASLENLIKAKTWCLEDSYRKASKQFKDQADLCRIGENYPELQNLLPEAIRNVLQEKSQETGMEF